jgi:hypothetical protein
MNSVATLAIGQGLGGVGGTKAQSGYQLGRGG